MYGELEDIVANSSQPLYAFIAYSLQVVAEFFRIAACWS